MATFNNLYLMVIFMASVALLINTGVSSDVFEPSMVICGPRPSPSCIKYVNDCSIKLHEYCDSDIFSKVFYDAGRTISTNCCHDLVHMGKSCHDNMTKYRLITGSSEFKQNKTQILRRSVQVWKDCKHRIIPPF